MNLKSTFSLRHSNKSLIYERISWYILKHSFVTGSSISSFSIIPLFSRISFSTLCSSALRPFKHSWPLLLLEVKQEMTISCYHLISIWMRSKKATWTAHIEQISTVIKFQIFVRYSWKYYLCCSFEMTSVSFIVGARPETRPARMKKFIKCFYVSVS